MKMGRWAALLTFHDSANNAASWNEERFNRNDFNVEFITSSLLQMATILLSVFALISKKQKPVNEKWKHSDEWSCQSYFCSRDTNVGGL